MSTTKKILTVVFSLLFIAVLGFTISWCVINFNQVKDGMSGTGVYTSEDLNHAYEDGYGTALTDKEEYENLINGYRDTIIALNDNISKLNSQVNDLSNSNRDYTTQIESLTEQKEILEKQVATLSNDKVNNEATIQSLNTVIYNLNKQISDMNCLNQNYTTQINTLNNRINELQTSINYYESYIATLENSEQVVATFEYDGSVYNIQIVNKGTQLSIVEPESTETKIFNGWKVDNNLVDLNNYRIAQNTKFVADVTYKFSVKFIVDNDILNSQIVTENGVATLPQTPVKDSYDFLGWSLNGVDIIENIETIPVTENTTYHAVFIKIHTVKFIVENQVVATQYVRNGSYANDDNIAFETNGFFNSWQVNETSINVKEYQVFADTTFIAKIDYKDWLPITWNGELTDFDGQYTWTDGIDYYYSLNAKQYVLDVATQTWSVMTWNGYSSIVGSSIWNDGVNYYYSASSKQYVLDVATHTWTKMTWYGDLTSFYTAGIWTDGKYYYYLYGKYEDSEQYILDVNSHTWTKKAVINNLSKFARSFDFYGENIWTDGLNCYYSYGAIQEILVAVNNGQYALHTNSIEQTGIYGEYIWTVGDYIYYSNYSTHYKFDVATHTWVAITWNGDLTSIHGDYIWTDGVNIYYSYKQEQYYFNGVL